jgi:hypothetical protein
MMRKRGFATRKDTGFDQVISGFFGSDGLRPGTTTSAGRQGFSDLLHCTSYSLAPYTGSQATSGPRSLVSQQPFQQLTGGQDERVIPADQLDRGL